MLLATVSLVSNDFSVDALDDPVWNGAPTIVIDKYWNGMVAPDGRRLKSRLLWSDSALYIRFEARQN